MANRKKRLRKSISSIKAQIEKHKIKKEKALEERKFELTAYHGKEIESMTITKSDKDSKLHRKEKNYKPGSDTNEEGEKK